MKFSLPGPLSLDLTFYACFEAKPMGHREYCAKLKAITLLPLL
jgi:hypothetical protein